MKKENVYHNLYSLIPFLPKPLYEEDMENLKDTVDTFVARLKRYNGDGKFDGRIDEILYEFEKWKENPDAYNRNHNIAGTFDKENEESFAMVNNRSIKSKKQNEIINKNKNGKKVKFNRKKLKRIGKTILVVAGAVGIAIGAKQAVSRALETIEVPVLDGNSISDINETYDTSWYNLPANEWFSDKDEAYKNDTINLTVSNKKADEVKDKAVEVKKEIEENDKQEKLYTFKYKVEYGDTIYALEKRFDCKIKTSDGILREGMVLDITTSNEELADEMNDVFNKENEPISFEYYTIQKGDTLPKIVEKFQDNNIDGDDIMRCNPQIESNKEIIEGQIIKIPVYENEKTNGMTR